MSLKAIDNQMMVTRTSEMGKDAANQVRKDGSGQEYLAIQARNQEEHDKKSVGQLEEAYHAELKNDKEGPGGGPGGQGGKRKREGPDDGELPAGFNQNKIDIKI